MKGFIETLLTRNKRVNEYLEQREISKGYVTKRIVQNSHFNICKQVINGYTKPV